MKSWIQYAIVLILAGHFVLQFLYLQRELHPQPSFLFDRKRFQQQATSSMKNRKLKNVAPHLLPDRLITVFGLESSGTTFVATTIAQALGKNISFEDDMMMDRWKCHDNKTEIQHVSEPFGYFGSRFMKNNLPEIEPVFYPDFCMMYPNEPHHVTESMFFERMLDRKDECNALLNTTKAPLLYPQRFFINITSHIDWYRERGVDVTAVIVVRDETIHFRGIRQYHVHDNETAAREQYDIGRQLILQALHYENVILVSYETLMSLQTVYLLKLYKQLRINSTFVPEFRDGNAKHISNVTSYPEKNDTKKLVHDHKENESK